MCDILVLALILVALNKLPDGELRDYDRSRNNETRFDALADYCDCDRSCKDIHESRNLYTEDRRASAAQPERHRDTNIHTH